jgi:hypothetical protein
MLVFLQNSFFHLAFMPDHRPRRVHPDGGEPGQPGHPAAFQAAAVLPLQQQLPALKILKAVTGPT